MEPKWIEVAEGELGVHEIAGEHHAQRILEYHRSTSLKATDDETPWCSAFVNWVLKQCGIAGTNSAAARSWLDWGTALDAPEYGCIVILSRGKNPAQGHVGFYVGEDKNLVAVLGGNQGDKVSVDYYAKWKVLGYRRVA